MSVTKDGDTGRWMSQIRVTDWTGKTIHKKKRGFATKKEALQWERDFISQSTGSLGMTFGDFIALYVKDMEHRLKPSTVASKKWLIDLKVTPFFKKIPLNEIKPTHVRQWQNSLTSYRDENGKPYAQTYLKCINNQELICKGWFLPPNTYDCGSFVVNGTAVVGKEKKSPYNRWKSTQKGANFYEISI